MTAKTIAWWRACALLPVAALAVVGLTAAYMPGAPAPRPNLLINPTAEIDQVDEGSAIASSAGALDAYAVDGIEVWLNSTAATKAAVSCQRAADAPTGYTYSLKCTVTTAASAVNAGDYLAVAIPIEADNLQDALLGTSGAQSLCRQWQVKSSIGSYTYGWALQNFAQTRSYPNAETIATSATWTPFQSCFGGDTGGSWVTSGNAGGAYLIVTLAAGSTYQGSGAAWSGGSHYGTSSLTNSLLTTAGATFEITNAKLEISPVATPFQRLSMQQELARAQRYLQKSYSLGAAVASATRNGIVGVGLANISGAQNAQTAIVFPVQMRAAPAVSYWDGAGNANKFSYYAGAWTDNNSGGSILSAGTTGFYFTSGASASIFAIQYLADARL